MLSTLNNGKKTPPGFDPALGIKENGFHTGSEARMSRIQTPCLELIIRSNQHDFIRLVRILVSCGQLSILTGLDHFLRGLLGVLLVGWGEVVNGILHHVSWVYGFLQTTGDAVHRREVLCRNHTERRLIIRQVIYSQQNSDIATNYRLRS